MAVGPWRQRPHHQKTLAAEWSLAKARQEQGDDEARTYDVLKINTVKTNGHSRRQRRLLMVTKDGFGHYKGSALRHWYRYDEIRKIELRGPQRCAISVAKTELVYETPYALQIFTLFHGQKRDGLLDPSSRECQAVQLFLERQWHTLDCMKIQNFYHSLLRYVKQNYDAAELIETAVIGPLLSRIERKLREPMFEAELEKQRIALRDQPAAALGVDARFRHLSWTPAISRLSEIDQRWLPSFKLATLVETAKEIHSIAPALNADDVLPIFILVFVRADLRAPALTRSILRLLIDPALLSSEPGYYLTMFESAINYVGYGNATADAVHLRGPSSGPRTSCPRQTHHRLQDVDIVEV